MKGLKGKACIKFKGEINSMSTLKKTWMERYSGGRLASIKDNCNDKPHMKTLRSFKASALNIPAEVGLKKVVTSVSLDEFKLRKRNANITYILFHIHYC